MRSNVLGELKITKNNDLIDDALLAFQKEEVEGAILYEQIANSVRDEKNRAVLRRIADDERRHAEIIESHTGRAVGPSRLRLFLYRVITFIAGYTFAIKLMERGENDIKTRYHQLENDGRMSGSERQLAMIIRDEERHETVLLEMLEEERVDYIGSMVLGMNDALVELTGALAGYTFAMQNTRMISMAGIITGFSATLSMAASQYLSARADGHQNALKAAVYTGIAYLITVVVLITPYLTLPVDRYMPALFCTMIAAIAIIALFNWYISVTLDRSFKRGFMEMTCLSIGVAILSFIIGIVVKNVLHIDL